MHSSLFNFYENSGMASGSLQTTATSLQLPRFPKEFLCIQVFNIFRTTISLQHLSQGPVLDR